MLGVHTRDGVWRVRSVPMTGLLLGGVLGMLAVRGSEDDGTRTKNEWLKQHLTHLQAAQGPEWGLTGMSHDWSAEFDRRACRWLARLRAAK